MVLKTICLIVMFALQLTGGNIDGKNIPSSGTLLFETTENSPEDSVFSVTKPEKYYPDKLYSAIIIMAAVSVCIMSVIICLIKFRKMRERYVQWLSGYLHDVQSLYCRFDETRKITDMLFDNSTDAGIMIRIHSDDLTTRIVCIRVNCAFEEVFSVPARSASGKELNKLLPKIDCSGIYSAIDEPGPGNIHNFEYCHEENKFFIVNVSIADNSSGCLRFTDITESRQLIKSLSGKLKNIELATTAENMGMWSWDIHSDSLYFSASHKKMLGYDEYEFPSRIESVFRLMHPEDKGVIIDHFYRCTNGSKPGYSIEFRMKTKSGDWCWIRSNTRAVCDSKGVPSQLIGLHIDITEEKLLKNEFAIICDSSPVPLIILDEFKRIKQVNDKAKTFRENQSEAIGLRLGEWLRCRNCRRGCGDNPRCSECPLSKLLAVSVSSQKTVGPEEIPIDLWMDNGKRNDTPLHLAVCMKSFHHGSKCYTAVWLEDISAQKQAENNYRKIMDSMRRLNRKINTQQPHTKALLMRAEEARAVHKKFLTGLPFGNQNLSSPENAHDDDMIICKEKLLRKTGRDRNHIQNTINGFIREIPLMIASIEEYITTDDMESAGVKAQIIKGFATGIGAEKLKEAAEKLETMTGKGDFTESINTMLWLEAEFECVKSALKNFLMEYT